VEEESSCHLKAFGLEQYSHLLSGEYSHPDDIHNHVIKNKESVTYQAIVFDDSIWVHEILSTLDPKFKHINFVNCVFVNDANIDLELESLSFDDCCLEGKCYINKQYGEEKKCLKINRLSIKDTVFHANFKLHNCEVENFVLRDVDFERNADFFKTKFLTATDIVFFAVNFRGLALFGDTVFKEHVLFEYVTFEGYTHFRKAHFKKGLNLEYANIEKEMNFFGVTGLEQKQSKAKTTRETYRIIKYQLTKVGNIIDSNKFHALELAKRTEEVCCKPDEGFKASADCIVLGLHKLSSNHSTSWPLAFFWVFLVGVLTNNAVCGTYFGQDFYKFSSLLTSLQDFGDDYFMFFLNKVLLGYLYYQFLTAVRKDTRK
jgi:hypothetical protein